MCPRCRKGDLTVDLCSTDDGNDDSSDDDGSKQDTQIIQERPFVIPHKKYCASGTLNFGVGSWRVRFAPLNKVVLALVFKYIGLEELAYRTRVWHTPTCV